MPYHSMWAALQSFKKVVADRAGGLRPSYYPLEYPHVIRACLMTAAAGALAALACGNQANQNLIMNEGAIPSLILMLRMENKSKSSKQIQASTGGSRD
jgi:hypothetical protein